MRRNRIRSFVTKTGQVVRRRAQDIETHSQQQRPPGATGNRHAAVQQSQHRPAGPNRRVAKHAAIGGIDMPRLAAFILLSIVCVFIVILVTAGIYRTGRWILSGEKEEAADVRVESNHEGMETMGFQKPVFPRTSSHPDARSGVSTENYDMATNRYAQPGSEMGVYGYHREQETHAISREPAVDYSTSIREMERVLRGRSAEMRRITESLRNISAQYQGEW